MADEPMTAELLRRLAERPDAPPRLLAVADAVRDGRFTWEDAAAGNPEHALARSLHSPKAKRTLLPLLAELRRAPEPEPPPAAADDEPLHHGLSDYELSCPAPPDPPEPDDDFSRTRHLHESVETPARTRHHRKRDSGA